MKTGLGLNQEADWWGCDHTLQKHCSWSPHAERDSVHSYWDAASGRSECFLPSGENVKWWECFRNVPPPNPWLHVPSQLCVCGASGNPVRLNQMESSHRLAWEPLFSSCSRAGHGTNCYSCRPHLRCFWLFKVRFSTLLLVTTSALN